MADRLTGAALVLGASMRLTRAVVTDDVGGWFVRDPAFEWAYRHHGYEVEGQPKPWRYKIVSGLDCPFCVGYWIGAGVLVMTALTRNRPLAGRAWRGLMASLALNEVAAHLGARLGDVSD